MEDNSTEEAGGGGCAHLRDRKKEKGDIGVEKGREKEEGEKLEKLEVFFGVVYDFLSGFENS